MSYPQVGSIGVDFRRKISEQEVLNDPYRSVVFLINNDGRFGSGAFLMDKNTGKSRHIITCAHNFVFYLG
jgi:hypothetical protein